MAETSILDLAELPQYAAKVPPRRAFAARHWGVAALLALALAMGTSFGAAPIARALESWGWAAGAANPATVRIALGQPQQVEDMNSDDRSQIMVEGLEAQDRNAAIPLSGLPLDRVNPFQLASYAETYATAFKCLSQAVYYEAAVEPLQGRRAVAQVVLNRMRHPAYPNSVCGVVYQGSQRRTGCQFSFTCDGSLLRQPMAGPWREAQLIAREALAGYVEPSVGAATHYHADYVLPKWAFQLAKIDQIGRHIFYRFTGNFGRAANLRGRYAGAELIPSLDLAALRERAEDDGTLEQVEEEIVPGLTVAPHVTDRHAASDVGGRIDTTKSWRLSIPDPTESSARYRELVGNTDPAKAKVEIAAAVEPAKAETRP